MIGSHGHDSPLLCSGGCFKVVNTYPHSQPTAWTCNDCLADGGLTGIAHLMTWAVLEFEAGELSLLTDVPVVDGPEEVDRVYAIGLALDGKGLAAGMLRVGYP